jgi:hypothetical protein
LAKTYGWTIDYILSLDHYVVWRLADEIQADAWDEHVLDVSAVYDGVVRAIGPMFSKEFDVPPLLLWHQKLYPKPAKGAVPEPILKQFRQMFGLKDPNQ